MVDDVEDVLRVAQTGENSWQVRLDQLEVPHQGLKTLERQPGGLDVLTTSPTVVMVSSAGLGYATIVMVSSAVGLGPDL